MLIDVHFVGVSDDDDVCMRNKTITSTLCISTPADYSKPTLLLLENFYGFEFLHTCI